MESSQACVAMTLVWFASGRCVSDSESVKVSNGGSLLGDCLRQTPAARLPPSCEIAYANSLFHARSDICSDAK